MRLIINGKAKDYASSPSLGEILEEAKIPPQTALIEINGVALVRDGWPEGPLPDGTRLEILRITAGG
jgi:thiamine biosynthesis protein ThiS